MFKELSKKAREQSWKTEKVPPDLFRVFDRLLARDKEIQEKRARDALQFASSLRTLGADQQKPASSPEAGSRLKKTLSSLSRRKRATICLRLLIFHLAKSFGAEVLTSPVGISAEGMPRHVQVPVLILKALVGSMLSPGWRR